MSGTDKARNKAQKVRGKAKEVLGRATRDRPLEAQGKDAQRGADLKDVGEKIKDVVRPKGTRRQKPK
ncbi:MAG: CsbD family protein [Mycobacteriaceae bacterium]|nr:CsbD family protein [Mycobacteriaceae bacterium]